MGIGASVHFFPPVHQMKPYLSPEFKRDDLSVTERVIDEIVTLPMYPQMTDDDISYMVEVIKNTIVDMES